ncbi:sugar phosphate isomerase/epimerase [Marinoscillum sp. 108]|uniref:sugar phosphate isomerase/epimerase family protein n=1 Tax=Marinoscillum sp. 108 TaxID=2653151 RepID=UPI0012F26291|nr:sugar phosphate isomerase/epimerase [Marinoscillum sp. 108]VXD13290.1 Sugar phosphate isomerase [Marinoscillum sp. 108]
MKILIPALLLGLFLTNCQPAKKEQAKETIADEPLFTEPLGIAPFTFRRSFPNGIPETLDTIVSIGFTSIEGGGGDMDPYEYKKLCESKGLTIPSMGTGYNTLVEDPLSVIERAKILGAEYVMCAWLPHEKGNFTLENARKTVEDFNTFGKILADSGITFCYHAHGYEFQPYEDGTLLDYIIQNTNPEYVSFEMDIFWIQFGGGDPAALLDKYGSRWKLMHVKDLRKGVQKDLTGLTDTDNDVTVGDGELDIPAILKAAKRAGIKHYFIEDESDRIITQIPKSIEYLRSLKI